jgi:cellulose synthase/poly-beta-1,6-N-acetylglucosamine synthase-like glycosyltransferase
MIFLILFIILAALVVGIQLVYSQTLKRLVATKSLPIYDKESDNYDIPLVSILIAVHNEGAVIERRLDNIFESSYPPEKIQIVVVDSGSTDNTSKIIDSKFCGKVDLLVEKERTGKAHAINLGLAVCRGDIVVLSDGPTLFEKETLTEIVKTFRDPAVGGVTVPFKITNTNENWLTKTEGTLWSYKDSIRIMESKILSTSWLSGEACAFRKKLISQIPEESLADDSFIALRLISDGYRVIVNNKSFFSEKSMSKFKEYFRVKIRRAVGGIRETLRFKYFMFNSKFGTFGLVCYPYRFFTEIINPIISITMIALLVPALFELYVLAGKYVIFLVALAIAAGVLVLRYEMLAFIFTQVIMIVAIFLMMVGKKDVRWFQAESTRG